MIDENRYRAYLVRFQRGKEASHWRVTLQNAHTGEVKNFATENEFFSFLMESLKRKRPKS
jgi:hypothetical protein